MKTSCSFIETFSVRLTGNEKVVRRFGKWLIDNEIFPLTNTFSGGPDCFFGSFSMDQKKAIIAYFEEAGIKNEQ